MPTATTHTEKFSLCVPATRAGANQLVQASRDFLETLHPKTLFRAALVIRELAQCALPPNGNGEERAFRCTIRLCEDRTLTITFECDYGSFTTRPSPSNNGSQRRRDPLLINSLASHLDFDNDGESVTAPVSLVGARHHPSSQQC